MSLIGLIHFHKYREEREDEKNIHKIIWQQNKTYIRIKP